MHTKVQKPYLMRMACAVSLKMFLFHVSAMGQRHSEISVWLKPKLRTHLPPCKTKFPPNRKSHPWTDPYYDKQIHQDLSVFFFSHIHLVPPFLTIPLDFRNSLWPKGFTWVHLLALFSFYYSYSYLLPNVLTSELLSFNLEMVLNHRNTPRYSHRP